MSDDLTGLTEYIKKEDVMEILSFVNPNQQAAAVANLKGVFMAEAELYTLTENDLAVVRDALGKMGYNVVKKRKELPILNDCPKCGKRSVVVCNKYRSGWACMCYICKKRSMIRSSRYNAYVEWNKMVDKETPKKGADEDENSSNGSAT